MKRLIIPFVITTVFVVLVFLFFEGLEDQFVSILTDFKDNKFQFIIFSFLILSSDILLPVPSSVVMFTNGFVLGWLTGFFLSFSSVILGSTIGFYLGKLTSHGFPFKIDEKATAFLLKHGPSIILISRGIPVLSESISIAAGFNRLSFNRYFLLNLIGYFPVCLIYAIFGSWGSDKNIFLLSFLASLFISGIFWWVGRSFLDNITNK